MKTSEQDDPSSHLPFSKLSYVSFLEFIITQKRRNELDPLYLNKFFA